MTRNFYSLYFEVRWICTGFSIFFTYPLLIRPFFRACPGARCSLFCSRAHKICWQRARFALSILAGYFLPQPLCYFLFSRTCFPFRSFFKWQPDGRQITIEWVILKVKIYFKDSNLCLENIMIITWKEVNRCYNPDLPNLLPPVNVVLTILSTSADCEREFSKTSKLSIELCCFHLL